MIDETWGLDHSRVDIMPEIDIEENVSNSESESEYVDSGESDVEQ